MPKLAIAFAAVFSLLAIVSCGGGDSEPTPDVHTPIPGDAIPLILNTYVVVGENRMTMGLLDSDSNEPILGAKMNLRFFQLTSGGQGTFKFETDADAVQITKTYTHTHDDGTVESHEAGETGAYVAHPTFDAAGDWGVEITTTLPDDTAEDPVNLKFSVVAKDPGVGVGDPLPPSNQAILADVTDIRDIDSSSVPIPEQHDMTVADAVASGKPTVVTFATPAFCATRICGPTKDVFDVMYNQYKGQANFIHIEPYDLQKLHDGTCAAPTDCVVGAAVDFKLDTEPWVFVADSQGIVRAKFDGIVSEAELQAAITAVLPSSGYVP